MSIEATLGFDNFEDEEKDFQEREQKRAEKEEAGSDISEMYKKATAWQDTVDPKDKSRVAKYSIGKLNGYEKSKDMAAYCKAKTSPEQFLKDLDAMTAKEFADAYGFSELSKE